MTATLVNIFYVHQLMIFVHVSPLGSIYHHHRYFLHWHHCHLLPLPALLTPPLVRIMAPLSCPLSTTSLSFPVAGTMVGMTGLSTRATPQWIPCSIVVNGPLPFPLRALGVLSPDVPKTLLPAPLEPTHSPPLTPTNAPRTAVRKIATLKADHPRGACGFHLKFSLELTDDAPSGSLTTKTPPSENVYVLRALAEPKRLSHHLSLALPLPLSPLMALPMPLSLPMSLTLSPLLSLPLQLPLSCPLPYPCP